jgi:hypothetical protein
VRLFKAALDWNRLKENLERAESVWLGILEAFNPKLGLLNKVRETVEGQSKPGAQEIPKPQMPPAVQAWLGKFPVKTGEKHGG